MDNDNERGMHTVSLAFAFALERQPRDVTSMDASEEDARARRLTGFEGSSDIFGIDFQSCSVCFFCIPIITIEGIWRAISSEDEDGMRIWLTFERKRQDEGGEILTGYELAGVV